MHRNLAHRVRCGWFNLLWKKCAKQWPTKWSLQALRMILSSSCFLKEKKKKGNIGSIQSWDIDRREFLIKEQRDYQGRFKVYFRMSVAQFDDLPAILKPLIKNKTTNFCELYILYMNSDLYTVLCAARWSGWTWQSAFWILAFACVGSELSKHISKCFLRMRKTEKIEPDPIFFMTDENFGGSV